jgi:uncharacterized protein YjbJ (UPF0337 family)
MQKTGCGNSSSSTGRVFSRVAVERHKWKQFTGKAKEQWGKLTDHELTQINGNREQLEGKIQAKYGYAKDKAKQEVDDWCNRL